MSIEILTPNIRQPSIVSAPSELELRAGVWAATFAYAGTKIGAIPFMESRIVFTKPGIYSIRFSTSAFIHGSVKTHIGVGILLDGSYVAKSTMWINDGWWHLTLPTGVGVFRVPPTNLTMSFQLHGLTPFTGIDEKDCFSILIENHDR